jgi:hypothetical protein
VTLLCDAPGHCLVSLNRGTDPSFRSILLEGSESLRFRRFFPIKDGREEDREAEDEHGMNRRRVNIVTSKEQERFGASGHSVVRGGERTVAGLHCRFVSFRFQNGAPPLSGLRLVLEQERVERALRDARTIQDPGKDSPQNRTREEEGRPDSPCTLNAGAQYHRAPNERSDRVDQGFWNGATYSGTDVLELVGETAATRSRCRSRRAFG